MMTVAESGCGAASEVGEGGSSTSDVVQGDGTHAETLNRVERVGGRPSEWNWSGPRNSDRFRSRFWIRQEL